MGTSREIGMSTKKPPEASTSSSKPNTSPSSEKGPVKLRGDETLEELVAMGIDPSLLPDFVARYGAQFSNEDLLDMVKRGEIQTQWIQDRPSNFTEENLQRFILGEITWAQLQGLTMEEAYGFAKMGYTLFEQGRYDQAQQIFEGLVISNPYDAYFHSMLGAIYARKDMQEEAAEEYSIAIELDPENITAFVSRAELLLQHGDFDLAMNDLKSAIALDPKGEDPAGLRARALAGATAAIIEEVLQQKQKGSGGR